MKNHSENTALGGKYEIEHVARIKFIRIFSVFGISVLFIYGLVNLSRDFIAGVLEIFFGFLLIANLLVMRLTNKTTFSAYVMLFSITVPVMFLLFEGGIEGLGLNWITTFPIVAFFLLGKKVGFRASLFILLIIIFLTILQSLGYINTYYNNTKIILVLSNFLVIAGLSYFYENVRKSTENLLKDNSIKLNIINEELSTKLRILDASEKELKNKTVETEKTKLAILNILEDLEVEKKQLRESEENLSEAQRIGKFGSFVWNLDTNDVTWSDESFRIHGWEPADDHIPPAMEEYFDRIIPEDRDHAKKSVENATKSTEFNQHLYRVKWSDGSLHYVRVSSRLTSGKPSSKGVLKGTFQDITEAKTREMLIEQAKLKDEAILASIGEGMVATDENGKIIFTNLAFEEILGFDRNQVIGDKMVDLLKLVDKNRIEVERNLRPLIKALNIGETTNTSDYFYLKKDGDPVPVDLTVTPIKMDGHIQGVIEVFSDITKEKEYLSQIERFKLAVEEASDMILMTDKNGIVVYANKAVENITGFKAEEAINKKAGELWGGLMDKSFYEKMWNTISVNKQPFYGQVINKKKNGEKYYSEIHITPVADDVGNVSFYVSIERDITKEKELEKTKDEFLSMASHELRTPLAAIDGLVSMMREGEYGLVNEELMQPLNDVNESSERLIHLVNDLLSVSRIQAGRLKFNLSETSLVDLINKNVQLLDVVAKKKDLYVNKGEIDGTLVQADPDKITQVITNLVGNSIKFTDQGGVTIYSKLTNTHNVVYVEDTGIGMKDSDKEKLFGRFSQLDSGSGRSAGTGLGLYISKQICQKMGGDLWLESTELGKGSLFAFSLPLVGSENALKAKDVIDKEAKRNPDQKSDLLQKS